MFVKKQTSEKYIARHFFNSKRKELDNVNQYSLYASEFSALNVSYGRNFFKYYTSKLNLACFLPQSKPEKKDQLKEIFVKLTEDQVGDVNKERAAKIANIVVEKLNNADSSTENKGIYSSINHLANIDFEEGELQRLFFRLFHMPAKAERSVLYHFLNYDKKPRHWHYLKEFVAIDISKDVKGYEIFPLFASKGLLEATFGEEGGENLWKQEIDKYKEANALLMELGEKVDPNSKDTINTAITNSGNVEQYQNFLTKEKMEEFLNVQFKDHPASLAPKYYKPLKTKIDAPDEFGQAKNDDKKPTQSQTTPTGQQPPSPNN